MNTKKHLVDALKKAGLPNAYSTILHYEAIGVIPKAKNPIDFGHTQWRSYSDKEIENIVERVKKHVSNMKNKRG